MTDAVESNCPRHGRNRSQVPPARAGDWSSGKPGAGTVGASIFSPDQRTFSSRNLHSRNEPSNSPRPVRSGRGKKSFALYGTAARLYAGDVPLQLQFANWDSGRDREHGEND